MISKIYLGNIYIFKNIENIFFSMRKSLADERKIRHSKRKDKKNKSKFEKNPLCLMRLSQGYEQL